ncbi:MAG: hypothetical protein ACT4R6_14560 [Gemmatimonadaceae bacterium]
MSTGSVARESIILARPTERETLLAGTFAGLTGGAAMALWAVLTSVWHGMDILAPMRLIGTTFLGADAVASGFWTLLFGFFLHTAASATLGILFATLLPASTSSGVTTLGGVAFAAMVFIAMTYVIVPAVSPVMHEAIGMTPRSWVIQHALFGLSLAAIPSYRAAFARESVRVSIPALRG